MEEADVGLWWLRIVTGAQYPELARTQRIERSETAGTPAHPGDPMKGALISSRPSVLFVCVKNGGKSQMAAALMRHRVGTAMDIHSAGTRPGSAINDLSAQAVAEVGADMSGQVPRPIDPDVLRSVDRVVLVGAEAQVEPAPGMTGSIETWETDEPSLRGIEGLERIRLVRDDIDRRVQQLAREFEVSGTETEAPGQHLHDAIDGEGDDPAHG